MNLVQWSDGRPRLSHPERVKASFAGKVPSTACQEPSEDIRHAFQQYAVLRAKTIFAIALGTQNPHFPRSQLDRDEHLRSGFGKCNLMRRITSGTYRRLGLILPDGEEDTHPGIVATSTE